MIIVSDSSHFENSMTKLEDIIAQLEKGDLSLEVSLAEFEKGIVLARECQSILKDAEQKIEMITSAQISD